MIHLHTYTLVTRSLPTYMFKKVLEVIKFNKQAILNTQKNSVKHLIVSIQ